MTTAPNRATHLRASDPRLPLMASRAAIEFDNALQGKTVEFKHSRLLADFIRESFEFPSGQARENRGLDAATVDIVGQALLESGAQPGISTLNDVVDRAVEIAGNMEHVGSTSDSERIDKLRLFCIALGNALVAYRESLQEYRPISRYRRLA
ncbi:MAG: hypothetical protein V1929_12530 [bacterium]